MLSHGRWRCKRPWPKLQSFFASFCSQKGDYPGLDEIQSPNFGLSKTLLLFIFLFSGFWQHAFASVSVRLVSVFTESEHRNAVESVHHLKVCEPFSTQSFVLNSSPNVCSPPPALQKKPVVWANRRCDRNPKTPECSGSYGGFGMGYGIGREPYIQQISFGGDFAFRPQDNKGRRYPKVLNFYVNVSGGHSPSIFIQNESGAFDEDIGPKLMLGGSFTELPEPVSGLPKSESEAGNRYGSKQSEKAVVPVYEPQRTDTLSLDEDSDDEAVLIGTFGGLIGGYVAYALTKTACDRILRKIEENESGADQSQIRENFQ